MLTSVAICIGASAICYLLETTYFNQLGNQPHIFLSTIFCSSLIVLYASSYYYPNQMTGAILGILLYKFAAVLIYLIVNKPLEKQFIIAFFSLYFIQLLLFIMLVIREISNHSKPV